MLPNQFLGKGYTQWFDITFAEGVRAAIRNLFMVPSIACLLFMKDTMGFLNVQLMLEDGTSSPSEGWRTH